MATDFLSAQQTLPNLVGLGAPKAATTYLARELGKHPDIYVPASKEVYALWHPDAERCRADYAAVYAGVSAAYRVDFSTLYLSSENALRNAEMLPPDRKFIVSLRNPIQQVQSYYWHSLRQSFMQKHGLSEPLTMDKAIREFPKQILEPALYSKHLERWISKFGMESIIIVFYDDIKINPTDVLSQICRRLDLQPRPDLMGLSSSSAPRRGVHPRSAFHYGIYSMLYSGIISGVYAPLKRQFGIHRVDSIKERLKLRQIAERLFFAPGYPEITEAEHRLLLEKFRPDVERLAELISEPRVLRWVETPD